MSETSARMVSAARANDWGLLTSLERDIAGMREQLARSDIAVPLTAGERQRKVLLIHRILDEDAEVRRYTEPWMEHVRAYLGTVSRSRSLDRAYGSMSRG